MPKPKHRYIFEVNGKKHEVELEAGKRYTLGRHEGSYDRLVLKDEVGKVLHDFGKGSSSAYVSRNHVSIEVGSNGELTLTHQGKNSTYVQEGGHARDEAMRLTNMKEGKTKTFTNDIDVYVGAKAENAFEIFANQKNGVIHKVTIKKIKKKLGIE